MIIAIGADHHGFTTKEIIKTTFSQHTFIDVGSYNETRSDYPFFAHKVAKIISAKVATHGILLCASGIGMAIVANRYEGIYAGVVWNEKVAKQAKAHDNINVIVLACDYLEKGSEVTLIKIWLETKFLEGRYAYRIALIDNHVE